MIDPSCRVKSVILESYQNAAYLCEEYYDYAPDIEIKGGVDKSPREKLYFFDITMKSIQNVM